MREAEGVEAGPVVGAWGVADDFVDAALGAALDGGVDGGWEHAGHWVCSVAFVLPPEAKKGSTWTIVYQSRRRHSRRCCLKGRVVPKQE